MFFGRTYTDYHQSDTAMVEVFKTNVQEVEASKWIIQQLLDRFQADKVSFDLEDCDKVLRVEAEFVSASSVIEVLTALGYQCEMLL